MPDQTLGVSTPLLVTGAHRTGTTWVGKMLAASGEAAYISEPLNHWHRPGVLRAPTPYWYTYICEQNDQEYLTGLSELLRFRYHLWAEIKSLRFRPKPLVHDFGRMLRDWMIFTTGRLRRQRPLLKDPFAVFSIPWFIRRFNCQVIVTVRHPAAFASSLKRLDWDFDFSNLLNQPFLMSDWLEPYRSLMDQQNSDHQPSNHMDRRSMALIEGASLLWRIVYEVVEKYRTGLQGAAALLDDRITVVRHEDLSLEPLQGFRELYDRLDLSFTNRAQATILSSSNSENPQELPQYSGAHKSVHGTRLDSRANLQNWKRRLSAEEISRIRQLTESVAVRYYPDFTWE